MTSASSPPHNNFVSQDSGVYSFSVAYGGWLSKQGHSFLNWRRRYFVIKGCVVQYYTNEVNTLSIEVDDLNISSKRKGTFVLVAVRDKPGTLGWSVDSVEGKSFALLCETAQEKNSFMAAMRLAVESYRQRWVNSIPRELVSDWVGSPHKNTYILSTELCRIGAGE